MLILFLLGILVAMSGCESSFNPFFEGDSVSSELNNKKGFNNGKLNNNDGPRSGAALYAIHCANCHGADAKGAALWPSSIEAYEPIESIVVDGRGAMAPVGIDKNATAKIQAFLLTLGTKTADLDGKGLYGRYCASCHGADATGTDKWKGSIQAYEPIASIVNNGRGSMGKVALLAKQVSDIQAYLMTLGKPLSELNGSEVYARLCVGCHGEKGAGDAKGMQLRYDDLEFSRYWIRNGRRKTLSYTSDMPAYPASQISDQQIDEMFMEIDAVPRSSTGKGLFNQYCANCHGMNGRGGPSGEGIRGGDEYGEKIRKGKNWKEKKYWKRGSYMSKWSSSQISGAEVQKITSYGGSL